MNNTVFCADALAEVLYPHLVGTEDIGKHLQYTDETLHAIAEEVLSINLERMDDELKLQVPKDWKVLERPKRTLITLMGVVSYRRRVYLDSFGCRRYLLDEILGIGAYQRIECVFMDSKTQC